MSNPIKNFIKLSGINQRSWLNPLFLALFPALIIIWLQPVQFTPLIFNLYLVSQDEMLFFEDLEADGKAERIRYGDEREEGHAHIRYYNDENQYIGQYNFLEPMAQTREPIKPYAVDFNNDKTKDLVFISQNEDSLFLDIFDFKNEKGLINKHFITTVGWNNEHKDYYLNWLGHYDANSDSIPELYFSVAAGFALYPRRIFRYDFVRDSLITSINTGAGYLPGAIITRNDSMLILCGSSAYGNIKEDYPFPYHDTTTWLFAFDKNLELAFSPKNYGIDPGGIQYPISKDGFIYYLFASNNAYPENKLFKMNWHGEVVDSIVFDFYVAKSFTTINDNNKNQYYILQEDGDRIYMQFDIDNFKIKENKVLKIKPGSRVHVQKDLDDNGEKELLVVDNLTKQIYIYNSKPKKQNTLDIGDYVKVVTSNYYKDKAYGDLIVNTDNKALTFRYFINPHYKLRYPLYLGIYFISLLFIGIIQFFQNRRTQQRQQMEQQLADLQLQNLRNQLDPHFTFNVLNSVGNAIYKQDKEGAYDLFQRFTRIIRSSLMSSDKVFRSLKEELQFTQDYLEFQKLRFKTRFNYSIEVEKGIDTSNIQFPKMLIQGFAENAVKHAFYGVDYTGQISISVFREGQYLKVTIEDDGIGINRSKELKATSGTQKGLEVLKEQVKQINRIYEKKIVLTIKEKPVSETLKYGTEITIRI